MIRTYVRQPWAQKATGFEVTTVAPIAIPLLDDFLGGHHTSIHFGRLIIVPPTGAEMIYLDVGDVIMRGIDYTPLDHINSWDFYVIRANKVDRIWKKQE